MPAGAPRVLERPASAWDDGGPPAGLAAGDLVYIAHQLDFAGRSPG
jgi:hypothetical protein